MKVSPLRFKHLTGMALVMLCIAGFIASTLPRVLTPAVSATSTRDDVDIETARAAYEQAKENEFGLQASGGEESAIRDAALAADKALKAYNEALSASGQLSLPLAAMSNPSFTPEVENNNPLAGGTAQFLNVSPTGDQCVIVDGAINPSGDVDVYRINVPSGTRAWVLVDTGGAANPDSETRNSTLRIFRSDLSIVETDFDDGTGNGLDLTTETELASAIGGVTLSGSSDNNYFIEVNEFLFNDVIDPYRLFVVVTNSAAAAENNTPNNSRSTPDVLVPSGQSVGLRSGASSADSDNDWYSIEGVQAGDIVYVNLGAPNGRNHVVDFFLPSNATTTPDFSANSAGIGIGGEVPAESFAFLAQASGTYLLRVRRVPVFFIFVRLDSGPGTYTLMGSICRYADLQISKADSPDPVIAGGLLTYTIDVTNNGPSNAQNVRIDDTLPTNVKLVNINTSPGGIPASSVGMGGVESVSATFAGATAPGQTRTLTITARVCPDVACNAVISNTATTSSDTHDPDLSSNSSTAMTSVNAQADLQITKSVNPQPAVAGCTVTFTITVTNQGPSNSTGTTVVDTLPPNFTVLSVSSSQGSTSGVGTGTATANIGALGAPNQCGMALPTSATVTIVAQVPPGHPPGVVTNSATVSRDICNGLADPGSNTAQASFAVFDVSLQDEASRSQLIFRSDTGEYIFCCANGVTRCGRGKVIKLGSVITLEHVAPDRRVMARVDRQARAGNASLKTVTGLACAISDHNIFNNTLCSCSSAACALNGH